MYCIRKVIYKDTLYFYDGKDVKKVEGQLGLLYFNACIKTIALLIPRNPWYLQCTP